MIILINIYSSVYTQQNQIKKNKSKNKKKHRNSTNNSCLFKTQSHTIPEVLSSFGNSAYNIKKMKYKERPVLHAYTDTQNPTSPTSTTCLIRKISESLQIFNALG